MPIKVFHSIVLVISQNFLYTLAASFLLRMLLEFFASAYSGGSILRQVFLSLKEMENFEDCGVRKPHSGLESVIPSVDYIVRLLTTIGCGILVTPQPMMVQGCTRDFRMNATKLLRTIQKRSLNLTGLRRFSQSPKNIRKWNEGKRH